AAADSGAPRGGACRSRPLRSEVVRELGEVLVALVGDENEILEAYAAEALAVEAGLDGDDVARNELLASHQPEDRLLVDLEPDAVTERMEEPLVQRDPLLLGPPGLV